jgi:hypothetical protein
VTRAPAINKPNAFHARTEVFKPRRTKWAGYIKIFRLGHEIRIAFTKKNFKEQRKFGTRLSLFS